eukprot:gb/GECH01011074.1/.p1 GENE.gb/GECH01011074.1/~~gb/GECH01011074.1/.p1  ORF type:complete len:216 (+),score=61.08 gb/GECH01011074.1/:1-648(+)
MVHRGPDASGVFMDESSKSILVHERLSIVDVESGAQPITCENETMALTVNGEIYNHQELRKELLSDYNDELKTKSDCEVILHGYRKMGKQFIDYLKGDFAFVIYDSKTSEFIIARDPIGVIPFYVGYHSDGSIWFASEMKCLHDHCDRIESFPPGHLATGYISLDESKASDLKKERYYSPAYITPEEQLVEMNQDTSSVSHLEEKDTPSTSTIIY